MLSLYQARHFRRSTEPSGTHALRGPDQLRIVSQKQCCLQDLRSPCIGYLSRQEHTTA
jgi:hypothetical protein